MREHLEECVLHRFVGVVSIAEVVIRDAHGPPLLAGHKLPKPFAREIAVSRRH